MHRSEFETEASFSMPDQRDRNPLEPSQPRRFQECSLKASANRPRGLIYIKVLAPRRKQIIRVHPGSQRTLCNRRSCRRQTWEAWCLDQFPLPPQLDGGQLAPAECRWQLTGYKHSKPLPRPAESMESAPDIAKGKSQPRRGVALVTIGDLMWQQYPGIFQINPARCQSGWLAARISRASMCVDVAFRIGNGANWQWPPLSCVTPNGNRGGCWLPSKGQRLGAIGSQYYLRDGMIGCPARKKTEVEKKRSSQLGEIQNTHGSHLVSSAVLARILLV
ncbi:hypothetical protein B0T24DRAFT_236689 [Lasiosphaeria ovina]|uniref:Uncharacterized protein n=1 Tax=Lasiosphaeria ovina TaxID=92902 RepID=A0AAE0NAW5_9PEZI|nr:hypothetical protein B0T24DRAFT_236689 [Lasiosphaeria ovina]